ncbi:MAG: hypothetical protein VB024_07220 [Dysgonamonadaceae bacterium]|jgi:hypothetical protein|nr:hypothetical protein [Dysgonamonadaceae bacterium]MDD3901570.1 hypothetical protein [Dysgonamonadaceae bacterium]MEA5081394.1 hypothetical protein [Dysgonamonadaceae bacterium]
MKKNKICSKTNFLVVICLFLLSPVYGNNDRLPDPKIQAGIAQ